MAKATLRDLGLCFEELDITNNARYELEMHQRSKRRTVPQIFIDEYHIGGNDDFQIAVRNGELKQILQANKVAV
jgi:glutaredoxin 3